MKYLNLFFLSFLTLVSCSSNDEKTGTDTNISGSRIIPFSSCEEIEGIVSDLLYNNRDLVDSVINTETSHYFKCEWEQEQTYDPNDMFIMRATSVRTNYELAHMTMEELSAWLLNNGSHEVNDSRLQLSQYDNVIISKSFNQLLNANTYTAYVWVEDEQINRIIIEDINWSDNIPALLDDSAVVDILAQMLEPID